MELSSARTAATDAGGGRAQAGKTVTSPSGTQAVDRAARLLTEVMHSPGSVTFTELAATTGLAKSTTSRLLLALERNGLVQRDDHGRFRPGEMFVSFAWRGGAEAGLAELAQPFLERLGEQSGETINLGVERDCMIEQIAQVDSVYVIGVGNWLGRPVPLHCTALGKVLLAYDVELTCELTPFTRRTIVARAVLARALAEVRDRGWAVDNEENVAGEASIAAPIRGYGGLVVGAIGVFGAVERICDGRPNPALVGYVRDAARAVSRDLGALRGA